MEAPRPLSVPELYEPPYAVLIHVVPRGNFLGSNTPATEPEGYEVDNEEFVW